MDIYFVSHSVVSREEFIHGGPFIDWDHLWVRPGEALGLHRTDDATHSHT